MALRLEDKKAIVTEVANKASSALSAVVADYSGLSVNEMNDLRKKARDSGVYLRVVRNNLAKIAFKGTEFECLSEVLKGPLICAFSEHEPGAAAKVFNEFTKTHKSFTVKHLAMSGSVFGAERLEHFAKLPNRDEALSLLLNVMIAPVTKLVRTFNDIPAHTVRVVAAVGQAKQS